MVTGGAAPAADQRPVVTQQVLKQRDPQGGWQFSYQYPQISVPGALMGVQSICQDFNQQMKGQAQRSLAQFQKAVTRNASTTAPVATPSRRNVDYVVVTRTPGLLVFKYTQFEYLRGMAHPATTIFTQNFAMRGQFLKLDDLFTPNSGYLEKIAATVGRELRSQARKKRFEIIAPQGYAAKAENFQNFLIRRSGLDFLFNPYQVAPGYVGVVSARVPWSALEGDLSDLGHRIRRAL
jgi:Protein of unknown function (DUF3298)